MRNLKFILITILIPNVCFAEFICRSEIQYRWKRDSELASKASSTSTPAAEGEQKVEENKDATVFWAVIEVKGATEEEAKAAVNKQSFSERASADRACIAQHENLAGCISSKYSSLSSTLSTLSFGARKDMEVAISNDCKSQQGKCLGSTLSEIKCSEIVAPVEKAEEGAKDGKDKKDSKKK